MYVRKCSVAWGAALTLLLAQLSCSRSEHAKASEACQRLEKFEVAAECGRSLPNMALPPGVSCEVVGFAFEPGNVANAQRPAFIADCSDMKTVNQFVEAATVVGMRRGCWLRHDKKPSVAFVPYCTPEIHAAVWQAWTSADPAFPTPLWCKRTCSAMCSGCGDRGIRPAECSAECAEPCRAGAKKSSGRTLSDLEKCRADLNTSGCRRESWPPSCLPIE